MFKVFASIILSLLAWQVYAASTLDENLNDFIEQYIDAPREHYEETARQRNVRSLRDSGILERAINVGDYAPEFTLQNAVGKEVSLYNTLLAGPVVLVWYRGGWCPYCNLQLKQIQEKLTEITQVGGQVLAISPELPDKALTLRERHNLEFNVLSDIDNQVADTYKLAYNVSEHVVDHYDLSYTLNEYNGADAQQRLPLAVTYVIDRTGLVEYAFLDADFANRAKPEDVLEVLSRIKNR